MGRFLEGSVKMTSSKPWYEAASEWRCLECGTVNPMSSDVCSGCDCSLDGFIDDEWLYEKKEEELKK